MDSLDPMLSVAVGIALAAACGFRVFVPFLAAGLAARGGHLALAPGFEWLASDPALLALGVATLVEVGAYFVPWLDHALDVIATPSAVVAGVLASAAVLTDVPPLLRWSIALVGGGGAAGIVQSLTALTRLQSAALTGGLANPLVAAIELAGAAFTALLAIALPLLALALVAAVVILLYRVSRRLLGGRGARPAAGT